MARLLCPGIAAASASRPGFVVECPHVPELSPGRLLTRCVLYLLAVASRRYAASVLGDVIC